MNVECVAFPFEIKLDSSGSRDGDYHIFSTIPRKGIKNYLCRPGEYSTFLIVMNPRGVDNNMYKKGSSCYVVHIDYYEYINQVLLLDKRRTIQY